MRMSKHRKDVGPGHRLVRGKEQPFEHSANSIIQIYPGEKPQPLHRDRHAFVNDGAFEGALGSHLSA